MPSAGTGSGSLGEALMAEGGGVAQLASAGQGEEQGPVENVMAPAGVLGHRRSAARKEPEIRAVQWPRV